MSIDSKYSNKTLQDPSRPIQLFVSAQKGGPSDGIARTIAEKLAGRLGKPVLVEHKAPMNACFDFVAKAPADGHTLMMAGAGFFINASLYRNLPFDARKDFAPVSLVASIANVLVIHPSIPAHSIQEFVAYAKANPGVLRYGSSTFGGPPHLAGELFKQMTAVDMVHIPYSGHVAAGKALVEGRDIQLMFDAILTAKPHIDAGEVVPLAVTSLRRAPIIGDVPTLSECGITGYEINPDMGVLAPAGTPLQVISQLSAAIREVMQSADVMAKLSSYGMEARGTTPEEFGDYTRSAFGKWATVMKNAGIEPRDTPS